MTFFIHWNEREGTGTQGLSLGNWEETEKKEQKEEERRIVKESGFAFLWGWGGAGKIMLELGAGKIMLELRHL